MTLKDTCFPLPSIVNFLQLYQKYREDPPIQRDMPPIAGKIAWARQLTRKIQTPMMVYRVKNCFLLC